MKQSFCINCFRQPEQPLSELFGIAKEIGYAGVELWRPPSQPSDEIGNESLEAIWAAAKTAGLAVVSFTGHESIDHGLNDPTQWERIEAELVESVNAAARLGIPGVICFSGTRRPGLSDAMGLAHFVKGVRAAVRHAESKGVNLNLEVLNSRKDHPQYMADSVDWAIAACEAVNSPRLKVLFDIYHVQVMHGDVIASLRRCAPFLGHIHTAGVPGRNELDDHQELNYRGIGRALEVLGYEGYVGHELFPKGDRIAALRTSFAAMA